MIPLFKVFMADTAPDKVKEVLLSGYVGQGEKVENFERAFSEYVHSSIIPLSLNSCTSALDLALHLIGVYDSDEVLTVPITCTATNSPIITRGAIPVWCDVDPYTGLIDVNDVGRKITKKTKAIMAVDWGGRSCDYTALKRFDIPVIQDSAHRLLPLTEQKGDYIAWSFQAIKHVTCGDGGMLLTPEDQLERARLLRWYGLDRRSSKNFRCEQDIKEIGYKYQMNDIAAVIGIENLKHASENIFLHQANALYYNEHIHHKHIMLPEYTLDSSWWIYTVLVDDSRKFMEYLKTYDIDSSPVHARNDKHTAFHYPNGNLIGVDHFDTHQVSIPVGWWITAEERNYIVKVVNAYV